MSTQPHSTLHTPHSLSRYWLLLGVAALAIAGLFALVLVAARSPDMSSSLVDALFHKALVVHVDLSVLVWFLCIACLMWSMQAQGSRQIWPWLEEGALICAALGTLAIAASPLDPHGKALMSNYIPAISSPLFFLGLGLLLCGVALMLVRLLTARHPEGAKRLKDLTQLDEILPLRYAQDQDDGMRFGIYSSAIIAAIAILAFFWSFDQVPTRIGVNSLIGEPYYNLLFWGGGHVLQLVHTQILLLCWLLLMRALHRDFALWPIFLRLLFSIGLFAAFVTPLPYLFSDATMQDFQDFFTHIMMFAGSLAPLILACCIVPALWRIRRAPKNALWASLVMSLIVFIYGGVLGGMIHGQNVVIPAHYHGSIVGVTLGFMGAAYLLLPRFGYRDVSGWKLAFWQPFVYGGGQILHVSGLAWSGGYGVLRKTPGGLDALPASVKAGMGLMGIGGAIAITGGFMFVIVVGKAVFSCKAKT